MFEAVYKKDEKRPKIFPIVYSGLATGLAAYGLYHFSGDQILKREVESDMESGKVEQLSADLTDLRGRIRKQLDDGLLPTDIMEGVVKINGLKDNKTISAYKLDQDGSYGYMSDGHIIIAKQKGDYYSVIERDLALSNPPSSTEVTFYSIPDAKKEPDSNVYSTIAERIDVDAVEVINHQLDDEIQQIADEIKEIDTSTLRRQKYQYKRHSMPKAPDSYVKTFENSFEKLNGKRHFRYEILDPSMPKYHRDWIQDKSVSLSKAFANLSYATSTQSPYRLAGKLSNIQSSTLFTLVVGGKERYSSGLTLENEIVVYNGEAVEATTFHEIIHSLTWQNYKGVRWSVYDEGSTEILSKIGYPAVCGNSYPEDTILVAALGSEMYMAAITDLDYYKKVTALGSKNSSIRDLTRKFAKRWNIKSNLEELYDVFEPTRGRQSNFQKEKRDKVYKLREVMKSNGVNWGVFLEEISPETGEFLSSWLTLNPDDYCGYRWKR